MYKQLDPSKMTREEKIERVTQYPEVIADFGIVE